jgi:hypothetical protein
MSRSYTFLVAAFMSATILLASTAQALEIQKFDKMDEQDQNEYVAELVLGAQKILTDAGKTDHAANVEKLFTTVLGNDRSSVGVEDFMSNSRGHALQMLRMWRRIPARNRLNSKMRWVSP